LHTIFLHPLATCVVGFLHCPPPPTGTGMTVGFTQDVSAVLGNFVTVLVIASVFVTVALGSTVHLYLVNVGVNVVVAMTFWISVGAGAVTVLTTVVVVSDCSTTVSVVVVVVDMIVLATVGVTCWP
jgi:hypothetical protein